VCSKNVREGDSREGEPTVVLNKAETSSKHMGVQHLGGVQMENNQEKKKKKQKNGRKVQPKEAGPCSNYSSLWTGWNFSSESQGGNSRKRSGGQMDAEGVVKKKEEKLIRNRGSNLYSGGNGMVYGGT